MIFPEEEEEKDDMEDVQPTGVLPTGIQEDREISENIQEPLPPEATQESFNPLPEIPTIVEREVNRPSNQSYPMYPTWMLGGSMIRYMA